MSLENPKALAGILIVTQDLTGVEAADQQVRLRTAHANREQTQCRQAQDHSFHR
jgi:hypothetical protein